MIGVGYVSVAWAAGWAVFWPVLSPWQHGCDDKVGSFPGTAVFIFFLKLVFPCWQTIGSDISNDDVILV